MLSHHSATLQTCKRLLQSANARLHIPLNDSNSCRHLLPSTSASINMHHPYRILEHPAAGPEETLSCRHLLFAGSGISVSQCFSFPSFCQPVLPPGKLHLDPSNQTPAFPLPHVAHPTRTTSLFATTRYPRTQSSIFTLKRSRWSQPITSRDRAPH